MNPSCVLTGHFVPPTGYDPWMGLRHDYSEAEDFQQQWLRWNRACYGANSASRILNADGRIRDIVNNYRNLNFSVSPSLLDELARTSPNVYRRLLEGDADALARTGHGNALARPWSETPLPLLPADRADRQIAWGLAAFRKHFGRDAEGFCLPGDAVSPEILDLLVAHGLKFVLLSSFQAEGLMPLGSGSWQSLAGAPAPGDRPLRIDRPGGSLGAFFPDERLSRGLVQDHLLRDAGQLEGAVRQALQTTGFVHLAASGEVFGLEEPFADMCLAALWERLQGSSPVECGTYGAILEARPSRELVKLRKGDEEKGTSSVCPHGVSRWQRECGCRGSGRHQQWKEPLWNLLVRWEETLTARVERQAADLGLSPGAFRDALPDLVLGTTAPRAWAEALLPGRPEPQDALLQAARAFQWLQSFFPSDFWLADDPADPRAQGAFLPVLRVFDFLDPAVLGEFLGALEAVLINGGRTFGEFVRTDLLRRRHDDRFSAALILLDRLLRPRARYEDSLGWVRATGFQRSRHEIDDGVYRYTGQIRLRNAETDRETEFEYLLLEDHREGVSLYLKDAETTGKPETFDLQHLPMGDRLEIVQLMGNDLEGNLASETQAVFPLLRKSLVYARLLDVPPLPMARSLMELAVTRKILGMTEDGGPPDPADMEALEEELSFAQDFSLKLDWDRLNARFSRWLAQALGNPDDFTSEPVVKSVETLLASLGRWGFHPDLTVAQALVFEALRDRAPALLAHLEDGRIEALHQLKRLLRLGGLLWLDTSPVKNRVLDL